MTTSGVHQDCRLSPFLFNFVIDTIMDCFSKGNEDTGVQIYPVGRLAYLDYADDIAMFFESFKVAQTVLHKLFKIVPSFGMSFAPSKCKVMLQDFTKLDKPLTLQGEALDVVTQFKYVSSLISGDDSVTAEVSLRKAKARFVFMILRHLWRHKEVLLGLKERACKTTLRVALIYGIETWPMRSEDLKQLQDFDYRCL